MFSAEGAGLFHEHDSDARTRHFRRSYLQELSYRKQIARQQRTQYAEGIYRHKYYTVTLKCVLEVSRPRLPRADLVW